MTEPTKTPDTPNPAVDNDPAVLAEAKKLRIWNLRLARYVEVAKAIGVILQTFKAEAVSLMSGLGTLVLGWYQLRKWVLVGRQEVKNLKAVAKAERRSEQPVPPMTRSGRTGGGTGHTHATPTEIPTPVVMVPTEIAAPVPTFMSDPNTYIWLGLVVAFVWSSVVTWTKKKAKPESEKGGS